VAKKKLPPMPMVAAFGAVVDPIDDGLPPIEDLKPKDPKVKCQRCDDTLHIRYLGRDNDEIVEDCPDCHTRLLEEMSTIAAASALKSPTFKAVDYDKLVPLRLKEASDAKIRLLIVWADYCYWVKNTPIMHDYTFDALVREYQDRRPDDVEFIDRLGMWGATSG
jgi:hypothetical protein